MENMSNSNEYQRRRSHESNDEKKKNIQTWILITTNTGQWMDVFGFSGDSLLIRQAFQEFRQEDDSIVSYLAMLILSSTMCIGYIRHAIDTLPFEKYWTPILIISSAIIQIFLIILAMIKLYQRHVLKRLWNKVHHSQEDSNKSKESMSTYAINTNTTQLFSTASNNNSNVLVTGHRTQHPQQSRSNKHINSSFQYLTNAAIDNKQKSSIKAYQSRFWKVLLSSQYYFEHIAIYGCIFATLFLIVFLVVLQHSYFNVASTTSLSTNPILLPSKYGSPEGVLSAALFMPIGLYFVFKHVSFRTVLVLLGCVMVVCSILIQHFHLIDSLPKVCFGFILALLMGIEYHRQCWHSFLVNQQLQAINTENSRLAEEMKADELRHMIGNVAHDLKTPLSSFISGIDVIRSLLKELQGEIDRHNASTPQQYPLLTLAKEKAEIALEIAESVTNTNIFMIMTINRCIDYNKTLFRVKLAAKMENAILKDCVKFSMDCIDSIIPLNDKNMKSKSVTCRYLTDALQNGNICIHTDKQWLQENILCILGNAVKYSRNNSVIRVLIDIIDRNVFEDSVCDACGMITSRCSCRERKPIDVSSPHCHRIVHNEHTNESSFHQNSKKSTSMSRRNIHHAVKNDSTRSSTCYVSSILSGIATSMKSTTSFQIPGRWFQSRVTCGGVDDPNSSSLQINQDCINMAESYYNEHCDCDEDEHYAEATREENVVDDRDADVDEMESGVPQLLSRSMSMSDYQRPASTYSAHSMSPRPSTIATSAVVNGRRFLRFIVVDTGSGIAQEFMPDLFKEPTQTARLTGGTGLGLYSLAKRVETLGGQCGALNLYDKSVLQKLLDHPFSNLHCRHEDVDRRNTKTPLGCIVWFTIPLIEDENANMNLSSVDDYNAANAIPSSNDDRSFVIQSHHIDMVPSPTQQDDGLNKDKDSEASWSNSGSLVSSLLRCNDDQMTPLSNEVTLPITRSESFAVPLHSAVGTAGDASLPYSTSPASNSIHTRMTIEDLKHLFPRVLVVDDSSTILKLTSMSLKKHGFIVSTAENGFNVVEMIKQNSRSATALNVILMDFQMPIMDGIQAIRIIREYEASSSSSTPSVIIGFSAKSDDDQIEEAYKQGMNFFLPKPFLIKTFHELLTQAAHHYQRVSQHSSHVIKCDVPGNA